MTDMILKMIDDNHRFMKAYKAKELKFRTGFYLILLILAILSITVGKAGSEIYYIIDKKTIFGALYSAEINAFLGIESLILIPILTLSFGFSTLLLTKYHKDGFK